MNTALNGTRTWEGTHQSHNNLRNRSRKINPDITFLYPFEIPPLIKPNDKFDKTEAH